MLALYAMRQNLSRCTVAAIRLSFLGRYFDSYKRHGPFSVRYWNQHIWSVMSYLRLTGRLCVLCCISALTTHSQHVRDHLRMSRVFLSISHLQHGESWVVDLQTDSFSPSVEWYLRELLLSMNHMSHSIHTKAWVVPSTPHYSIRVFRLDWRWVLSR